MEENINSEPIQDENTPQEPTQNETSYIIEALRDGITVLRIMMDNLVPFDGTSLKDITKMVRDWGLDMSQNKVYRILRTLMEDGWVDLVDRRYTVGKPLMMLSSRYMKSLQELHEKIRLEINSL